MRPVLESGFFPAVLEALQLRGAETVGLWELTDTEWRNLLAFCDLAHLTLPLVMTCQEDAPGWVLSRAKRNLADNKVRVRRIATAYREIAHAFERAGVQHLVLKGFAQYPDFAELSRLPHAIGHRSLLPRRKASRRASRSQRPGIRAGSNLK